MNDTAELRLRQWVRLPPAEIVAVVTIAPVPQIAPTALRELLEPVLDQRVIVGWRLAPTAALLPELLAEFRSWRRRWTSNWSMGPVTNLLALIETAARLGYELEPEIHDALTLMCAAEHDDQRVGDPHLEPLMAQTSALRRALVTASDTERGTAIIDDMRLRPSASPVLRTWAPPRSSVLLAAAGDTSVRLKPGEGLVVVHGEPRSHVFADVATADLTDEFAVITSHSGARLRLASDDARPLGWLAPNSLRWHLEDIPLVQVWAPLLNGLPEAASAAALADTAICFTSDLAHM